MGRRRSRKNRAKKSTRTHSCQMQVRPIVEAETGSIVADAAKTDDPSPNTEDRGADLATRLSFSSDIIDKQYRSYIWNDGKVQALVRIDAALIAGLLVVLQVFAPTVNQFVFGVLAGSFACFVLSFIICLIHAIPRINSRIGNQGKNLRTMVGISCLSKEDYHRRISCLTLSEMLEMNCWQIVGMCKNNMRSYKLIRYGVILTMMGVLLFVVALSVMAKREVTRRNEEAAQPGTSSTTVTPPSGGEKTDPFRTSSTPAVTTSVFEDDPTDGNQPSCAPPNVITGLEDSAKIVPTEADLTSQATGRVIDNSANDANQPQGPRRDVPSDAGIYTPGQQKE